MIEEGREGGSEKKDGDQRGRGRETFRDNQLHEIMIFNNVGGESTLISGPGSNDMETD